MSKIKTNTRKLLQISRLVHNGDYRYSLENGFKHLPKYAARFRFAIFLRLWLWQTSSQQECSFKIHVACHSGVMSLPPSPLMIPRVVRSSLSHILPNSTARGEWKRVAGCLQLLLVDALDPFECRMPGAIRKVRRYPYYKLQLLPQNELDL